MADERWNPRLKRMVPVDNSLETTRVEVSVRVQPIQELDALSHMAEVRSARAYLVHHHPTTSAVLPDWALNIYIGLVRMDQLPSVKRARLYSSYPIAAGILPAWAFNVYARLRRKDEPEEQPHVMSSLIRTTRRPPEGQ